MNLLEYIKYIFQSFFSFTKRIQSNKTTVKNTITPIRLKLTKKVNINYIDATVLGCFNYIVNYKNCH